MDVGKDSSYYICGWLSFFRKGTNFHLKSNLSNIEVLGFIKKELGLANNKHINLKIKNKNVELKFFSKEISTSCKQIVEQISASKTLTKYVSLFYRGFFEACCTVLQNDTILFDSKVARVKEGLNVLNVKSTGTDYILLNTESFMELLSKLYAGEDTKNSNLPKCELFDVFHSLKKKYYDCLEVKYSNDCYKLSKTHFTDAGVDVFCTEVEKEENGVIILKTGLSVEVPVGYWGMLCPRSSIIKTGFTMANSFGVIDSSYRGEIKVSLHWHGDINTGLISLTNLLPHKFAQLIFIKQTMPSFTFVESIQANTNRGEGGHGSTDECKIDVDKIIELAKSLQPFENSVVEDIMNVN